MKVSVVIYNLKRLRSLLFFFKKLIKITNTTLILNNFILGIFYNFNSKDLFFYNYNLFGNNFYNLNNIPLITLPTLNKNTFYT